MGLEGIKNNNGECTVYFGNTRNREEKLKGTVKNDEEFTGKSINGSDLNLVQDDVVMKKVQARKESIKILLNTFTSQKKIDDDLLERRDHIGELREELRHIQDEITKINEKKETIREEFNVDKESQEYKDFKLLEKQQRLGTVFLSEEERERLKNMGPVTEFQKESLKLSDMENVWQERYNEAEKGLINEVEIIKGIKLELLKSDPMVAAGKEAEELMESASKEIIGMLLEESKDHIDDELEKQEEKAKEVKEAEEEKEKEKEKEKDTTIDSTEAAKMEAVQKADIEQKKIENEIKAIMNGQKMVKEDLKGISVDELL